MLHRVLFLCLLSAALLGGCASLGGATAAGPQPVTYVAIGASDSVGVGAREPERDGWVPRLYSQLPPGSSLANLGVSGSLLSQALDQQLPVALATGPDLVTVWLAVNDLNARVPLTRYAADLDRLLAALAPTGATVLIGNVPDLSLLPAFRGRDAQVVRQQVEALNRVIAETAARHGATVVDLRAGWLELADRPELISADGFHPSSEGYARMADVFRQALQELGALESANRG